MIKRPFILWFLTGPTTTQEDEAGANLLRGEGADVQYRNGAWVPNDGALEACDGVAGKVPARYAKEFPTAAAAIAAYQEALAAAAAKVAGAAPDTAAAAAVAVQTGGEKPATEQGADKVKTGWKPNA